MSRMSEPTRASEESDIIGKIALFLLAGYGPDMVETAAVQKLGVSPADAPRLVGEAKRRLTLAADYNRDEALGTAINRLNHCYQKADAEGDVKTCVVVQKELNRLMDLYRPIRPLDGPASNAQADLATVKEHLLGLGLGEVVDDVAELARLAVAEIVRLRNERLRGL